VGGLPTAFAFEEARRLPPVAAARSRTKPHSPARWPAWRRFLRRIGVCSGRGQSLRRPDRNELRGWEAAGAEEGIVRAVQKTARASVFEFLGAAIADELEEGSWKTTRRSTEESVRPARSVDSAGHPPPAIPGAEELSPEGSKRGGGGAQRLDLEPIAGKRRSRSRFAGSAQKHDPRNLPPLTVRFAALESIGASRFTKVASTESAASR
jgi:hypothetical protein